MTINLHAKPGLEHQALWPEKMETNEKAFSRVSRDAEHEEKTEKQRGKCVLRAWAG